MPVISSCWFVCTLMCVSVVCGYLPPPKNLQISSRSFVHSLTWEEGTRSPSGLHYTVRVRPVSDRSVVLVRGCEWVSFPLRCDLTKVLSNPEETYYAMVSASQGNQTSEPAYSEAFKPVTDTIPEPPLLKLIVCNQSLCVILMPPSDWLFSVYDSPMWYTYNLNISSLGGAEYSREVNGLKTVVLSNVIPSWKYCVSVTIKNRGSATRPHKCASVAASFNQGLEILGALSLVVMLFAVGITLLVCSGYLCLKTAWPAVLTFLQRPLGVQLLPWPDDVTMSIVAVETPHCEGQSGEQSTGQTETEEVAYEKHCLHNLSLKGALPSSSSPLTSCPSLSSSSSFPHFTEMTDPCQTDTPLESQAALVCERVPHTPQVCVLEAPCSTIHESDQIMRLSVKSRGDICYKELLAMYYLPLKTELQDEVMFSPQTNTERDVKGGEGKDVKWAQSEEEEEEMDFNINLLSVRLGGPDGGQQQEERQMEEKRCGQDISPPPCSRSPEPVASLLPSHTQHRDTEPFITVAHTHTCYEEEEDDSNDDDDSNGESSGYMSRN